jgi:hypothetical protein
VRSIAGATLGFNALQIAGKNLFGQGARPGGSGPPPPGPSVINPALGINTWVGYDISGRYPASQTIITPPTQLGFTVASLEQLSFGGSIIGYSLQIPGSVPQNAFAALTISLPVTPSAPLLTSAPPTDLQYDDGAFPGFTTWQWFGPGGVGFPGDPLWVSGVTVVNMELS